MLTNLYRELSNRRVIRTAAVYVAIAWLILQVADIVVPAMDLPEAILRGTILLFALGFPVAMALAWIFEVTSKGVRRHGDAEPEPAGQAPERGYHLVDRLMIVVLVLLVGILLIDKIWLSPGSVENSAPSTEPGNASDSPASTSPVAVKPAFDVPANSLAVMPFENLSDDPDQEFFSDGMTDDLITDLSRITGLFVVASSSTFTYKNRETTPQEVAQDLGVRYVLEGSIRRAGNAIRINAHLIDATTGLQLWAERYNRVLTDVFALQDEVLKEIVTALIPELAAEELEQFGAVAETNPEAYDELLRGLAHLRRWTPEDTRLARGYFEKAVALDPGYARAYANLAVTYTTPIEYGWSTEPEADGAQAFKYGQQAIALDSKLSAVQGSLALYYIQRKQFDEALTSIGRALELDPNYADGYTIQAHILTYYGDREQAWVSARQAKRLNPRYSFNLVQVFGNLHFLAGDYEQAAELYREVLKRNPAMPLARKWLAATYAHLGNSEEAAWEVEETLMLMPDFTVSQERETVPFRIAEDLELYTAGLRLAGFPD